MRFPPAWHEGLSRAARGRWRLADDAFAEAAEAMPGDPRPLLARAACLLARGQVDPALVLLETDHRLDADDPLWGGSVRWLGACARLAGGDPLGAEAAAEGLPPIARRRLRAAALLRQGRFAEGIDALLDGRRRGRAPPGEGVSGRGP